MFLLGMRDAGTIARQNSVVDAIRQRLRSAGSTHRPYEGTGVAAAGIGGVF
jgi:hypothetical protein